MTNQNPIHIIGQNEYRLMSFLDILIPSLPGFCIYFFIFIITVAFSQPSQFKVALQSFHVSELQGTFMYRFINEFNNIINTQLANEVAVYIFWSAVATGVYIVASRLTKNVNEFAEDLKLRDYMWPKGDDKNEPLKASIERLVMRIAMVALFVVYIFKIVPLLANIWKGSDLTLKLNSHSIKELILLFVIEILFLHLAVVIIRLFLLKRRIIND